MFRRNFNTEKVLTRTNVKGVLNNIFQDKNPLIISPNKYPYTSSNTIWSNLNGKEFKDNKTAIIDSMFSTNQFTKDPIFKIPNVIFNNCGQNFLKYNVNKSTFKNVENLFILSNVDTEVLYKFSNIFIPSYYDDSLVHKNEFFPNVTIMHDHDTSLIVNYIMNHVKYVKN